MTDAQRLLDARRPFEAHEVLEEAWKADATSGRALWQGLAQLAVGVTHALRGNEIGSRTLLARAAETLLPFAGTAPYLVDVDGLRDWATRAQTDLTLTDTPPRLRRVVRR